MALQYLHKESDGFFSENYFLLHKKNFSPSNVWHFKNWQKFVWLLKYFQIKAVKQLWSELHYKLLLLRNSFSFLAKTDLICPVNRCWIKHVRSMAHLSVLHFCYAVKASLFPSFLSLFISLLCETQQYTSQFSRHSVKPKGKLEKKDLTPMEH